MAIQDLFTQAGSVMAAFMFVSVAIQQYFPFEISRYIDKYTKKFASYLNPYMEITFREFTGNHMKKSEAFAAIRDYLSATVTARAKRLKADVVKNSTNSLVLSMADYEEVTDEYNGIKVWWTSRKQVPSTQSISLYPSADEKRYYQLTFHRRHREIITKEYIQHILKIGKAIAVQNRQKRLYTNNRSSHWHDGGDWSHVPFEHPATFETLAMATKKKEEIRKDLTRFSKGKEYYAKIGKAWKRGYLLYGPPGTGKSTMIAAMANFLGYDIYDLELTAVKDNTDLRRLLIETTSRSIIVIEDIDCSLNLTGQRKGKKDGEGRTDPISKLKEKDEDDEEEEKKNKSKVTLSGLLNFIDGIWSSCGGERIIIFTTNFVDKLDPALTRRGRMDKHIEMSYCCFEAFRVLAKNYLGIEHHELFAKIQTLLKEIEMSPADVAENLMPKAEDEEAESCLKNLIDALEATREEAAKKALEVEKARDEEARLKAEEDKGFSSRNRKCSRRGERKKNC